MQAREARLGVTLFNLEGVRREIEGDIAQLGERLTCNQEVAGSNPTISTKRISVTPRNPNRFKAQRSGFETKRRSKGANEVFGRAGNGEERTLRRRGPVAQLARAYD